MESCDQRRERMGAGALVLAVVLCQLVFVTSPCMGQETLLVPPRDLPPVLTPPYERPRPSSRFAFVQTVHPMGILLNRRQAKGQTAS